MQRSNPSTLSVSLPHTLHGLLQINYGMDGPITACSTLQYFHAIVHTVVWSQWIIMKHHVPYVAHVDGEKWSLMPSVLALLQSC